MNEHESSQFRLGQPVSVSRQISFSQNTNAFSLPEITSRPFRYENLFIGDVDQGGSCNVDILDFCPHNLTHLETSAHILRHSISSSYISDIPVDHLQGIVYLADLTSSLDEQSSLIPPTIVDVILKSLNIPINALALKTSASNLPENYDFSNKNFLALDPRSALLLNNYNSNNSSINCLLLDLPSTDAEHDGGKLLAHRAFFGLPSSGIDFVDLQKRVIIELAFFKELVQNYYYFITTPARIQSNAIITDIVFFPLL